MRHGISMAPVIDANYDWTPSNEAKCFADPAKLTLSQSGDIVPGTSKAPSFGTTFNNALLIVTFTPVQI